MIRDASHVLDACATAARTGELDLSSLVHGRDEHGDVTSAALATWWLLSHPGWRGRIVVPASSTTQTFVHRSGLLALARRRGLEVLPAGMPANGDTLPGITVAARITSPPAQWIRPDLQLPRNGPPDPDDSGRRYPGLQSLMSVPRDRVAALVRRRFVFDSSFVLYEMVDNVHQWAAATDAMGIVSVTRGGAGSWDRMHIVVVDDGKGIIQSLLEDPRSHDAVVEWEGAARTVLTHFLLRAFGDRIVHPGHGFHVSQTLARLWIGRIEVLSTDARDPGTILRARATPTHGVEEREDLRLAGITGTLVTISLNAVATDAARRDALQIDEQGSLDLAVG